MIRHIVLPFVILAIGLSSCTSRLDSSDGGGVRFGVRSGVTPGTKTHYSSVTNSGSERMDWKRGDRIRVASDLAWLHSNSQQNWADYALQGDGTSDLSSSHISKGILEAVPEAGTYVKSGLVWAEGGALHTFYGLYPSPSWLPSADQSKVGVSVNASSADLAAFLPASMPWNETVNPVSTQTRTVGTTTITTNVVEPDMRYAYMWARTTGKENGGNMTLDFYPMITTFDISIIGSSGEGELTLEEVELYSNSCALQGSWTATVSGGAPNPGTNPLYSGTALTYEQDVNNKIKVTMPLGYVTGGFSAATVSSTREINFKIFAFPVGAAYDTQQQSTKYGVTTGQTALTDLYLRFKVTTTGGPNKSHYLQLPLAVENAAAPGENVNVNRRGFVEFPAGKKINIRNIMLPVQQDSWIFSVSVDDLEEQGPDIVVHPGSVTPFDPQSGGLLEIPNTLSVTDPTDIGYWGGTSTTGSVISYRPARNSSSSPVPVPWTIGGLYATALDAITGNNRIFISPFVTAYAPVSTSAGSLTGESVRIEYNSISEGMPNELWLRIEQEGGAVSAMRVSRSTEYLSGEVPAYDKNGPNNSVDPYYVL